MRESGLVAEMRGGMMLTGFSPAIAVCLIRVAVVVDGGRFIFMVGYER